MWGWGWGPLKSGLRILSPSMGDSQIESPKKPLLNPPGFCLIQAGMKPRASVWPQVHWLGQVKPLALGIGTWSLTSHVPALHVALGVK